MSFLINLLMLIIGRIKRHNIIDSAHVSALSLKGNKIKVQNGTKIDKATEIGSHTYIGCYCYVTRAKIGRYVSIANNVSIGQGEHDLNKISTCSTFYKDAWGVLTEGECVICDDAWIGVDAVILRNVRVGIGAVIAANAVVTSDVPDFAVVAGVPARIIKYRFSPNIIELILNSKWWHYDPVDAALIQEKLEMEFEKYENCKLTRDDIQ